MAAPDPVQGDQWDRAELRHFGGKQRRQAAQEAQQVPPEQARHQKEAVPRLLQPRSRPHHREQRLAFLAFLVTFDWLTSGDIKIRLNNDTANNPKVYGAGDLR